MSRSGIFVFSVALASLAASSHAATVSESHPYYLHALEDLKHAEQDVATRRGDAAMAPHEHNAIQHINAAQYIIYQTAPKEQRDVSQAAPANKKAGDLHDALNDLHQAQADLNHPESDKALQSAKSKAMQEVERAAWEVNAAISDFEHHK